MTEMSIGSAVLTAVMGYAVVFFGLILLMIVVMILGKAMNKPASETAAVRDAEQAPVTRTPAPGSAGEIKLYDTDPKDAAMIIAIVADTLGKPINELRFISIREVKE